MTATVRSGAPDAQQAVKVLPRASSGKAGRPIFRVSLTSNSARAVQPAGRPAVAPSGWRRPSTRPLRV